MTHPQRVRCPVSLDAHEAAEMKLSAYNPNNTAEIEQLFVKTFSEAERGRGGVDRAPGTLPHAPPRPSAISTALLPRNPDGSSAGIFFSRITFEDQTRAFILAPVAVQTDFQGQEHRSTVDPFRPGRAGKG